MPNDPTWEATTEDVPRWEDTKPSPTGQIESGNINLNDRPTVRNPDGSVSTVRSIGVNQDGKEYVIPTVSEDGRIMSDEEARQQFRSTGRHLGAFDTVENANAYAQQLHTDQSAKVSRPLMDFGPTAVARATARLGNVPKSAAQVESEIAQAQTVSPISPELATTAIRTSPLGVAATQAANLSDMLFGTKTAPIVEGATAGAGELASGFVTPGNISLGLGTAGAGKIGELGLGAYFAAHAAREAPELWRKFQEETDPAEKSKLLVELAGEVAAPTAILGHTALRTGLSLSDTLFAKPETTTVKTDTGTVTTTTRGGEPNAIETGKVTEGNQPEHPGVPPGADVPENVPEVRQGESQQTGDSGSVQPSAEVPQEVAAPTTEPDVGQRADVMALAAEQPSEAPAAKAEEKAHEVIAQTPQHEPEGGGMLATLEKNDLFKGFEETPESQKVGLLPQPSQFVKSDVAKVFQGAIKGAEQVKAAFAPPNMSQVAGMTARVIRENAAELARKKEIATVGLQDTASALRKNSPAENLKIINDLETTGFVPNELRPYKAARQAGYDTRIAQVRAVNPSALQDLIENYFPHLWTKESIAKVQGNLANLPPDNPWAQIFGKRPLAGPASFLKQRTVPTTADGIAIGLEPVTTNPVALDLLKMHEMDRYVMGQKIMGELKDQGIAKFVPAGSKPDFGYTKIDDRIARVLAPRDWKIVDAQGNQMPGQKVLGDYYAPNDAARVMNNYLSPGLKGNAIYDGFRFVGNLMNQVQLGISMYHATFTAIDSATSTLALGLEQIARSGGSVAELAKGGFNIGKALVETPAGSFAENLWRGSKFLEEYSKPGTTNAELAKIVDAAVAGGARVRMDNFYNTGAARSMFDAISKGNYAGAALRAPFALIQAASKPLMEYAVPRLKLGIISQQLEFELSKLPKDATRDQVRTVAARVVDSVDNRMGQLIYDNLFWNKALKDGLMASVRSVGWNLGDIRELGGGALDTITAPKRAYDQLTKGSQVADNPVFTKRMAYAFALPFYVGVLGSAYQYLMTGEGPKDLQDVYMPRTGRMKADGTAERVMLPTYMKDIYPLIAAGAGKGVVGLANRSYSIAMNKLHPLITMVGQMLHNQDYYGNQIRNADDGLMTTIQKEAEFAGKSFRPFSFQGVAQREGGIKEKAQAVAGIMPAPRELTDTPAMRMIHDINLTKRPAGGYTEAQQQKRADKRAAQQGQDLRPQLFKRLSKEERVRVLEIASPDERSVFEGATGHRTGRRKK